MPNLLSQQSSASPEEQALISRAFVLCRSPGVLWRRSSSSSSTHRPSSGTAASRPAPRRPRPSAGSSRPKRVGMARAEGRQAPGSVVGKARGLGRRGAGTVRASKASHRASAGLGRCKVKLLRRFPGMPSAALQTFHDGGPYFYEWGSSSGAAACS